MDTLLRHYHFWGRLDTRSDPIPAAYNENDQVKYAGLYVAQEMALQCSATHSYRGKGQGCFAFLHDGARRCAPGCRHGNLPHTLVPRIALDRTLLLFENMYHAGPHRLLPSGEATHKSLSHHPLVLHFNGPAKVIFEREWQLSQWDPTDGQTPVLHLIQSIRAAKSVPERRAIARAYERNVTFLDPWLRRTEGQGPLRFSCDIPW